MLMSDGRSLSSENSLLLIVGTRAHPGGRRALRRRKVRSTYELEYLSIVQRNPLAMAQVTTGPNLEVVSQFKRRVTPDTSPFSPNFRIADNLPRLPSAEDWSDVSKPFESLNPVLNYSTELPGVKTIHCTLNVTFELLRRSLSPENSDIEIELGQSWTASGVLT